MNRHELGRLSKDQLIDIILARGRFIEAPKRTEDIIEPPPLFRDRPQREPFEQMN